MYSESVSINLSVRAEDGLADLTTRGELIIIKII